MITITANPINFQWVYNEKGEYKMSVHAFNFLSASRYELLFTVSSIPCRPPDLMIRDNSTEFWNPKVSETTGGVLSIHYMRSEMLARWSDCVLPDIGAATFFFLVGGG